MGPSDLHETLSSIQRSVTRTETLMETLVAPGGRIPTLEAEVDELKAYKVKASTTVTVYSGIVAALGFLGHVLMDVLRGKH
jgi:hypothetical protein